MTRHGFMHVLPSMVAIGIACFIATPSARGYTYIDENPKKYSSGDCDTSLSNLGDSYSMFRSTLNVSGWSGVHYVDDAWALDLIERTQGGEDDWYGDNNNLTIFQGHGNVNDMTFARSYAGYCSAGYWGDNSSSNIEMGMNAGAKNALFIASTCCYMNVNTTIGIATFGGNQILGFGSVASIDTTRANNFLSQTASGSDGRNWHAWIYSMEDKPGWFTGDNTTVAVTRGWDSTDVNNNRSNCGIMRKTCLDNNGYGNGPGIAWARDYIDHGCGGCALCP